MISHLGLWETVLSIFHLSPIVFKGFYILFIYSNTFILWATWGHLLVSYDL